MIHNGHLLTNAGLLTVDGVGTPTATEPRLGGWAHKSDGTAYITDLAAAAVPGTAVINGGWAFTPDGILYITSDVPVAGDTRLHQIATRADGAVRATGDVPGAGWGFWGGIAVKPDGAMGVF
jgi:hypothetical protein